MTYLATIFKAAKFVGVSGHLLAAICFTESHFQNVMVEDDGNGPSYGICQVKLDTAHHMDEMFNHKNPATAERLMDPYSNAFYAAKFVKYQLARYGGSERMAIDAYNRGYCQNSNSKYVKQVIKSMKRLFPDYESELTKTSIQLRIPINRKVK